MNARFENNEAVKFIATDEGRFTLSDEGRIESSYEKNGEFFYVVKSAGISVSEVPEAIIENVYSGVDKNIDSYLRKNESTKVFQDSDVRVGGTRKEMAAFRGLINLSDLSNIEKDSITAKNLIKKDKVYPKINYNEEKENGVSGGTLYLKDKLRESVVGSPIDNKNIRAIYVGLIQWLVELMSDVKDIGTFKLTLNSFYDGCLRKSILIANPELEEELLREKKENDEFSSKLDEFGDNYAKARLEIENIYARNSSLGLVQTRNLEEFKEADRKNEYWNRMYKLADRYNSFNILPIEYKFLHEMIYKGDKNKDISVLSQSVNNSEYTKEDYILSYGSGVKTNLIKTVLGDKFFDFIKENDSRDFVKKAYYQAGLYDPYTQWQYEVDNESLIKPKELKLKNVQDWIEFLSNENKSFRERVEYAYNVTSMKTWGYGTGRNKKSFETFYKKGDIDEMARFIRSMITNDGGYVRAVASYKKQLEEYEILYRIRGNDYGWFEKDDSNKKNIERTELTVNTAVPLQFIKRDGGIAVFDEDLDNGEKVLSFYKQNLGMTRITYGKSLPDNERMAHSKHFFQSIVDLSETLNWDVKALTSLGGLGIMFAAAGRSGAMAHFQPERNSINLTRGKGDGTVAHEMAHYIDFNIARISPKDNESEKKHAVYGSYIKEQKNRYRQVSLTQNISNQNIYRAMKTLMMFIKKGVPIDSNNKLNISEESMNNPTMQKLKPLMPEFIESMLSTQVNVIIEASDDSVKQKPILNRKIGETFEDAIEYYKKTYPQFFSYSYYLTESKAKKTFTAIANTYKIPSYKLTLNNHSQRSYYETSSYTNTNFYLKNAQMKSDYWLFDWELFARGFETYIFDKLSKFNRSNNYLVSGGYFDRPEGVYAFGIEREILYILYDHLFDVIKEEMKIGDFIPFRTQRLSEYIELNKDDTEKRKVVIDEQTDSVIELSTEKLERKELISRKLDSLIELINKNKKFAEGGELIKFDLIKNLFNFADNSVIN